MQNTFSEKVDKTVGIDFMSVTVQDKNVRLQIWDTAGQERFRSLIPSYLKDSSLILLVFSVTDRQSFEGLSEWMDTISKSTDGSSDLLLVANKTDLLPRVVTIEEAETFANAHKMTYLEYSAKEGSKEELHAKLFEIIDKKLLTE